jgi:DNA-binding HxlR family transcriptional regulator
MARSHSAVPSSMSVMTLEPAAEKASCCPRLHEAVELIGKRWSGAIIVVLLEGGPMRFSEIAQAIPQLSDRLLSERMKELEARGIVERRVHNESPVRVEYELTEMGRQLAPALEQLKSWSHRWLA